LNKQAWRVELKSDSKARSRKLKAFSTWAMMLQRGQLGIDLGHTIVAGRETHVSRHGSALVDQPNSSLLVQDLGSVVPARARLANGNGVLICPPFATTSPDPHWMGGQNVTVSPSLGNRSRHEQFETAFQRHEPVAATRRRRREADLVRISLTIKTPSYSCREKRTLSLAKDVRISAFHHRPRPLCRILASPGPRVGTNSCRILLGETSKAVWALMQSVCTRTRLPASLIRLVSLPMSAAPEVAGRRTVTHLTTALLP
jgi:hypothetical protein